MLYSTLGGGVGESGSSLLLQGYSLDLYQPSFGGGFHVEVYAGIAVGFFGLYKGIVAEMLSQILGGGCVGGGAVHVYQQVAFLYGYQVVFGLSGGIAAFLQVDGGSFYEKFFTSSCVFYVANLYFAVYVYVGDEAVGAAYEGAAYYVVVFHI